MNKIALLLGFLFISAGVLTGVYVIVNKNESSKMDTSEYPFEEKLKLGEELLNQSGKKSASKALLVFSEINSKKAPESLKFRIQFGLANSLQRNKDKLRALELYRELNQFPNISKEEKEKVSYSIGNLLLQLNQEEEGRTHLDYVLKNSNDHKLRSKTFVSIADHFYRNSKIELANKNYLQAIEEYPNNVGARIGWIRTLRKLGKDLSSYDIFDDYSEIEKSSIQKENKIAEPKKEKSISFEKAKIYFNKKDYSRAIQAFKKVLKKDLDGKDRERALYYLAESNLRIGKFKEALSIAEKILINEPTTLDRNAHYIKGLSYYGLKQYDKAAASFNTVIDKYEPSSITENAKAYAKESLKLLKEEVNTPAKKEAEPEKEKTEPAPEEETLEEDTTTP